MAEIIKTYRQSVPALRFVGKKYGDEHRVNGNFGMLWDEWFANGWFEKLEKECEIATCEDGDAYIGLMRWKEGEPFEYWIGIFCKSTTKIPEGFSSVDFPESDLGVAWVYGKPNEIYGFCDQSAEKCKNQGFKIIPDADGAYWFFERYSCPRFTTPDEKGNIILDICHFIEKQ